MNDGHNFSDRLIRSIRQKDSILVAGLDPQLRYMPPFLAEKIVSRYGRTVEAVARLYTEFNKGIIDAVHDQVCAVKPQMAFYEAYGHHGVFAFQETKRYAMQKGLVVIEDAKRGDGGDTADAYADGHIGKVPFWGPKGNLMELTRRVSPIRVDCMTIHPHIGEDCVMRFVKPVLEYGTGIFVVDKTSFKPNSRIEELVTDSGIKVWESIAHMVQEWGQGTEGVLGYRNVGVVLGATKPEDAAAMREALPSSILLVPGYGGGQGGTAHDAVLGANKEGLGIAVNSSRGITYAYTKGKHQTSPDKCFEAARASAIESRIELNEALKRAGKYRS